MIQVDPVSAFSDNYIWIIRNSDNNHCLIVDPGDANPVINYIDQHNLSPEAILITHKHADHVGGVRRLKEQYKIPSYGPISETKAWIDHNAQAGDTINLPLTNITLTVSEVPGHTLGHIAYHTDNHLFCGDTLFIAGCGRVFEGTMQQMHQSVMSFAELDDDTLIYCAHEYTLANLKFACAVEPDNPDLLAYQKQAINMRARNIPTVPSSIGLEKRINPFMRCSETKVTQAAIHRGMIPQGSEVDVFATIRAWKDNF